IRRSIRMVSAVSNLSWSYEEYGILFHHVLSRFLRVWDYPNKQNARALYGKRGHFSQTGTRLLCLLCSCFYP
ncbi:hypothetical protein, partial [Hominenteromicrobium sp.]|uniref:hypothetical protein n=1 Tax=Hominenteromicrobium sp. TaxID=3073581 RepID=UPI003AB3C187